MKIKNIEVISRYCPTQIEAIATDGFGNTYTVYGRYRSGILEAYIISGEYEALTAIKRGWKFFDQKIGPDMDGCISVSEMLNKLNISL